MLNHDRGLKISASATVGTLGFEAAEEQWFPLRGSSIQTAFSATVRQLLSDDSTSPAFSLS